MTPERFNKIRRVLEQRQPDLTVLADGVHKAQNLSAMLRTCDAVGIHRMHLVAAPGQKTGIWKRSAGGSARWVRLKRHPESGDAVSALKQAGFALYAAHLDERATDYQDVDYTRPCAIVMGAEKYGVSEAVKQACDATITIPMFGMVESYNVSVATALILAEARRQRTRAGLYDTRRLSDVDYHETLFEWCQPRLALYCRERGLAYPPLDATGDVLEPSDWYARVRDDSAERALWPR